MIRVLIQNSLHQNQNGEDVKNGEIGYLPDLSIFNLLSAIVLVGRILNYYPNYTLYFEEIEIAYYVKYNHHIHSKPSYYIQEIVHMH